MMSTSSTASYYKLDNFGRPLNQIPEWIDEGVALPFPGAQTTIRSQKFKKQFRKNSVVRTSGLNIVDNSKFSANQQETEPRFVSSYRKQRRYNNGTVGDLVLVSVGAEFKRGLIVGMSKHHKTFRPYFDKNNVVLLNDDGSPAGTRILAPVPSWFKDPKEIKRIEAQGQICNMDVQMNKLIAITGTFI